MWKLILLFALCLLAGCSSTTPLPSAGFPTPPAQLMTPPELLQTLNEGANENDALQTVIGNYEMCRRTADKLGGLQDWVKQQAAVQ